MIINLKTCVCNLVTEPSRGFRTACPDNDMVARFLVQERQWKSVASLVDY